MESSKGCAGCRDGKDLDFDIAMAFQPIVDTGAARIWGYEALVRGPNGESAGSVLSRVDADNRYRFDQACRVKAIETAAALFPHSERLTLSINFMPNAVYEPAACLRTSMAAVERTGLRREDILFEFTEHEELRDVGHVAGIVAEYRRRGFRTAIDDFGAGYSGLGMLAEFQPDLLKIDMALIRNIDSERPRQVIVAGIVAMARHLDITVLAEGIETEAELRTLRAAGIDLMQGYYFSKPGFRELPSVSLAEEAEALRRPA